MTAIGRVQEAVPSSWVTGAIDLTDTDSLPPPTHLPGGWGMAVDSTVLKVARWHFDHGDQDLAAETLRGLLKSTKRPMVALLSAKAIIEHERDLYKHENPTRLQHDVTHHLPDRITVEIVPSTQEAPKP